MSYVHVIENSSRRTARQPLETIEHRRGLRNSWEHPHNHLISAESTQSRGVAFGRSHPGNPDSSSSMCMAGQTLTQMGGGKVLLVDDMQLNRLVLGRMLAKMGFEVLEAENGLAALELFRCHGSALSCVLLDLQMPIMDGWETAEQLRLVEAACQWGRVPIVACTALALTEDWHNHDTVASSALQCGCDDLLEKMPTLSKLSSMLSKYVAGL